VALNKLVITIMIYRIQSADCRMFPTFRDRFASIFTIAHPIDIKIIIIIIDHNEVFGASASRDNTLSLSDYLAKCHDKAMNMITIAARPNVYRTTTQYSHNNNIVCGTSHKCTTIVCVFHLFKLFFWLFFVCLMNTE